MFGYNGLLLVFEQKQKLNTQNIVCGSPKYDATTYKTKWEHDRHL